MESNLPLDHDIHALEVTSESRDYLLEAAKWGRFLSIVGFVFVGLFALGFLTVGGSIFGTASSEFGSEGALVGGGLLIYMIFIFAIMFFPLYYLYSFSTKTIRAAKTSSSQDLTEGLKNLKSVFKFYGIFTAIILGFYALALAGMLLFGVTAML